MLLERSKPLLAGALFLALVPLLGLSRLDLESRRLSGRFAVGEAYYLPPAKVLKALSFGYNELFADLLWVRTIAYFADHLGTDRELGHLSKHLGNIVALDSHFRAVYRYGAAMLVSVEQARTNESVLAAIEMLKKAHRRFPDEWRIAFNIGAYYMYELRAKGGAEKARWKREGAEWIQRAALLGAHMPWLPSLAATILSEQGQRDLAIHHLQELYLTTQDAKMKRQIAAKLRHLRADQQAREIRRYEREFIKQYRGSALSFLQADLFVQLYQAPLAPFRLR